MIVKIDNQALDNPMGPEMMKKVSEVMELLSPRDLLSILMQFNPDIDIVRIAEDVKNNVPAKPVPWPYW
jgi:hypothetical protein